jgi:hypothetical protein
MSKPIDLFTYPYPVPTIGTNYIGGTGVHQHEAAWKIPLALQLVPAVVLGVGIMFMPFSPRYDMLLRMSIPS